jgi:transcriptional regulator with XRE-family HTH domain
MDSLTTGKFIARLRKEKKLTQSELADLLQVTDKAISRWETGEGLPEVSLLPNLAKILNVTVDELLDGARKQEKHEENMEVDNKKDLIRFNNHALLSLFILVAGYMLSVALVYLTRREWVALIAYIPVTLISVAYYMFQRVNFMVECSYTDDDKNSIYKNTRNLYFAGIVTFLMLVPFFFVSSDVRVGIGAYVQGLITFGSYFYHYAFGYGLFGFFVASIVSMVHFRVVYGKQKYKGFLQRYGWLILGEIIGALLVPLFSTIGSTAAYYLLIELSIDFLFCLVLTIRKKMKLKQLGVHLGLYFVIVLYLELSLNSDIGLYFFSIFLVILTVILIIAYRRNRNGDSKFVLLNRYKNIISVALTIELLFIENALEWWDLSLTYDQRHDISEKVLYILLFLSLVWIILDNWLRLKNFKKLKEQ